LNGGAAVSAPGSDRKCRTSLLYELDDTVFRNAGVERYGVNILVPEALGAKSPIPVANINDVLVVCAIAKKYTFHSGAPVWPNCEIGIF
jgi:hypothetical protein